MAIPYALFARGLREIGAPEAGLIGLVEPILNPIWVVLFVHERPAGPTVIGGLFLLAGLAYRYWPARMTLARRVPTVDDRSCESAVGVLSTAPLLSCSRSILPPGFGDDRSSGRGLIMTDRCRADCRH